MQMIDGYMNIGSGTTGDAKEFYDKMYSDAVLDSSGEDDFNFPFFGDNIRSFGNTFGDTFQDGFGGGGGIGTALNEMGKLFVGTTSQLANTVGMDNIEAARKQALAKDFRGAGATLMSGAKDGGSPGTYIETPMFYQFEKNDAPLEVSFMLSNTINSDYDKNHKLVQRLTYINRPLRKNSIAVDPPRIYQVRVPGHRLIRWAYCSNLSINFAGTRRIIDNVIVPEGYLISMSFQSLTLEHAGFGKDETGLNP
jgi:hypothetical protein